MTLRPEEDVSTPSEEFEYMGSAWRMIADIYAGSEAVRQAGEIYIPRHSREPDQAYADRLDNALVYSFLKQTVDELTGRAFSREPVFDLPESEAEQWRDVFLPDVDRSRRQASSVLRRWFGEGLKFGASHMVVEQREDDERPFWRMLDVLDVFFLSLDEKGDIEELRYTRDVIERDGFAEIVISEIVRMTPEIVEVYRQDRKEKWQIESATENRFGKVPMVSFFIEREGALTCELPLQELAELTINHTRKLSDLDTILRIASFPILAMQSASAEDGPPMVIGPHTLLTLEPEARAFYVEHSGASINVLADNLKALEERAATFGARLIKKRPSVETATGAVVAQNQALAPLQAYVIGFAEAVNEALAITQEIWGVSNRPTFRMSVDFLAPETDTQTIVRLRELGDLSRFDALSELKRRGIFSSQFDIENNEDRLSNEGPLIPSEAQ